MLLRTAVAVVLSIGAVGVAAGGEEAGDSPIDDTIDSYFALLSGPAGDRDWTAFRSLFVPQARLHALGIDEEGRSVYSPIDVDGYVQHVAEFVATRGFYQRDDCRRAIVYGRSATVVAAFESRLQPDGEPIDRGIISFHLVVEGDAWRIAGILWNSATAGDPPPREQLDECTPG